MVEDPNSQSIRLAAFEWLNSKLDNTDYVIDWRSLVNDFKFKGETIKLIGAKGIWKPKQIKEFPISITSVQDRYEDEIISDDLIKYSYRGTDPNHFDNVGLREAMKSQIPLIYFHQVLKGRYVVAWPVFIVADSPAELKFTVSAESRAVIGESSVSEPMGEYQSKYQTRQVKMRLHQSSFRELVLRAYRDHCAICNLKHRSLLDAAHIIPDSKGGVPQVNNGLSLCKIHHAAYDQNILGINPDYIIEVREDILKEVDGPMLKHGLQEMNKSKLILPKRDGDKPNRDYLDQRYQIFKSA